MVTYKLRRVPCSLNMLPPCSASLLLSWCASRIPWFRHAVAAARLWPQQLAVGCDKTGPELAVEVASPLPARPSGGHRRCRPWQPRSDPGKDTGSAGKRVGARGAAYSRVTAMFTDNDKGNAERFPAPRALMDAAPFGLEGWPTKSELAATDFSYFLLVLQAGG